MRLLLVVLWDLDKMARRTLLVATQAALFAVQAGVFGPLIASAASLGDYYRFYLLGLYASVLFTTSSSRAYDIAEEFEAGVLEYHMSLPIPRRLYAVGRTLGGGLASFLFTLPMLAVALALAGPAAPWAVALTLAGALLFSIAVTGLTLSIVLALKSGDAADILIGAMNAVLVRLSTVFYPAAVLTNYSPYLYASLANPVTHMADLLRFLVLPHYVPAVPPEAAALYLLGLAAGLPGLAAYMLARRAEGGGWR